jgi:ABC-type proline/glycine betaine transport system permease subunit
LSVVCVTIGGAFFVSAAQSAFNNQLIKTLAVNLPEINPAMALGVGATQIRQEFSPSQLPAVIDAYMVGLKAVFAITIAAFGISTLIGFFGSWKKINSSDARNASSSAV